MITIFYFVVFLLSVIMTGGFLLKNRKVDSMFILFSIMVTINCLGRYMVASASNLEMALLANVFLYVGGCYAPFLTVLVLTRLCNLKMPIFLKILLVLYSTLVLAFVMTIGKSPIYYKNVELGQGEGYNYLIKTYGPLHILYPIMMIMYAIIMIVYICIAIKRRNQISIRLVATISITSFSIFFMYIVERIISTDISFLALGYLVGIALMIRYFERINMYDITTNISSSFEKLNDYGYIVFDDKYRYVNSNEYIKRLFPEIKEWLVDKEVEVKDSYLYKECVDYLIKWDGEGNPIKVLGVGEEYYQMSIRDIPYGKKNMVGYLLEFVDRTMEKRYYNTIEEYNILMEKDVAQKTEEIRRQQERIQDLFERTVTALSEAVDAKDRYTSGHSKRVAKYAKMIAERLGKSKEEQEEIYRAGLLHDIGKIRVPADIINKPGKLTDDEFNIIKIHPVTGYHILSGISEDSFIAIAAKYHHERYDGKGYPNGLAGEKIPEVARILGVADSYDAMASNRSYRNALPQDVVKSEIENGKGTQFDPYIADVMLQMIDEDKSYTMKQTDTMNRRILSVDDEAMNNKIITHIMKDEPMYEVVSVTSGKEALELLDEQNFDLILLDVKMPEMDGLETLRFIREKNDIPVVLMTSDRDLEISTGFAEFGCNDYITKPFFPMLVKEVVHNMTEKANI